MPTSDHAPTHEELRRVDLAFEEAENAVDDCYHGGDRFGKVMESLRPRIRAHLVELAESLEQHDLGGALWKAVEAFDASLTP
jgi:hypothetical protein